MRQKSQRNQVMTGGIDRLHGNAIVVRASDGAFSGGYGIRCRIAEVLHQSEGSTFPDRGNGYICAPVHQRGGS